MSEPRFKDVSCSQCGQSFGPGDHGYSHCKDHLERPNDAYRAANPLGGPAAMFRTIAERLEAGEDYAAVLADYGLVHSERPAIPDGWVACSDRLPDGTTWCLVYADGAMNCMGFDNGQWKDWTAAKAHNIVIGDITHWMPLPPSPTGNDNDAGVAR